MSAKPPRASCVAFGMANSVLAPVASRRHRRDGIRIYEVEDVTTFSFTQDHGVGERGRWIILMIQLLIGYGCELARCVAFLRGCSFVCVSLCALLCGCLCVCVCVPLPLYLHAGFSNFIWFYVSCYRSICEQGK